MKIPVFKPSIKRRDMDTVLSCMVSDKLGPGDLSNELAKMTAKQLEISGGFTFSSYHTAISLCLDLLSVNKNDSIIVSALAPAVYLDVINRKGIIPLIADVNPDSGLISPDSIKMYLTKEPKAIIIHNTLGFVPDMDKLAEFNTPIIEDISHSLGSRFNEKYCGSFGEFCIISLDMENVITAGQGGLLLTKDKKYLKNITSTIENYYLSDFNSSLAIAQLKQLNNFIKIRNELFSLFSGQLMQSRHKTLIQDTENGENIPFSFPVLLETGMNEVQKYALKKSINTCQAFSDSIISRIDEQDINSLCPNAKSLLFRCLLFPLYPMLGNRNADTICKVLASLP